MRRQIALVLLRASIEHGLDDRDTDAPAHISSQIHHSRNLIILSPRYANVGHGVDGYEQEGDPRRLEDAEFYRLPETQTEVHLHHMEQGGEACKEASRKRPK